MSNALIVTYHAIEPGPAPLCVSPELFAAHLDRIAAGGARVMTVSELAAALSAGELPERAVAITFDDGYASVTREAAPLLAERGMRATLYCLAGWLGRTSDWPTLPARAPRLPLASAADLHDWVAGGNELGCHGHDHAPLSLAGDSDLERELVMSRAQLEAATGATARTFAYPYGLEPPRRARALMEESYEAACAGGPGRVGVRADLHALPRVDAHYLLRPALMGAAASGSLGPYLAARRVGARARRLVQRDYATPAR